MMFLVDGMGVIQKDPLSTHAGLYSPQQQERHFQASGTFSVMFTHPQFPSNLS